MHIIIRYYQWLNIIWSIGKRSYFSKIISISAAHRTFNIHSNNWSMKRRFQKKSPNQRQKNRKFLFLIWISIYKPNSVENAIASQNCWTITPIWFYFILKLCSRDSIEDMIKVFRKKIKVLVQYTGILIPQTVQHVHFIFAVIQSSQKAFTHRHST